MFGDKALIYSLIGVEGRYSSSYELRSTLEVSTIFIPLSTYRVQILYEWTRLLLSTQKLTHSKNEQLLELSQVYELKKDVEAKISLSFLKPTEVSFGVLSYF
jgi:hypothetical protein